MYILNFTLVCVTGIVSSSKPFIVSIVHIPKLLPNRSMTNARKRMTHTTIITMDWILQKCELFIMIKWKSDYWLSSLIKESNKTVISLNIDVCLYLKKYLCWILKFCSNATCPPSWNIRKNIVNFLWYVESVCCNQINL